MNSIKLSDNYTILRGKDSSFPSKKDKMLSIVEVNKKYANPTNDNSVWMEVKSEAFESVNSLIRYNIQVSTGRKFSNYAEHYWIYTQTKGFNLEWMHQHLLVHPSGRTKILTDYTFTYYIQTPEDIEGDEGHIVFEDENKVRHKFLPEEGDWFIFPADIRHTAIPTPNSELDRIVYAGSLCLDVYNQTENGKSLI